MAKHFYLRDAENPFGEHTVWSSPPEANRAERLPLLGADDIRENGGRLELTGGDQHVVASDRESFSFRGRQLKLFVHDESAVILMPERVDDAGVAFRLAEGVRWRLARRESDRLRAFEIFDEDERVAYAGIGGTDTAQFLELKMNGRSRVVRSPSIELELSWTLVERRAPLPPDLALAITKRLLASQLGFLAYSRRALLAQAGFTLDGTFIVEPYVYEEIGPEVTGQIGFFSPDIGPRIRRNFVDWIQCAFAGVERAHLTSNGLELTPNPIAGVPRPVRDVIEALELEAGSDPIDRALRSALDALGGDHSASIQLEPFVSLLPREADKLASLRDAIAALVDGVFPRT